MITNWIEAQRLIKDFNNEFKHTHYKHNLPKINSDVLQCVELDKPFKIYTGQTLDLIFENREDYYYLYFGQGVDFPKEKEGFAWLSDNHSIFFFERPFENKVVSLLKKLLPDAEIKYEKNDIYINGTKNGASLRTGLQKQIGDMFYNKKSNTVEEQKNSEPLSGMIYILRWDDLDGLNEAFDGVEHHQVRLETKSPLATLGQFLEPIGVSKNDFIKMLENK